MKQRPLGKMTWRKLSKRQYLKVGAVAASFVLCGILLLVATRAATSVSSAEAEAGTISGNAAKTAAGAASGGQAVKFGFANAPLVEAPYIVKAVTGGDSIAVVWTPSFGRVKNYEVYRNEVKVATVTPGSGTTQLEVNGRSYIDKNVTRGSSYTYKVRAISDNGSASPFKSTATVTHPTATTPVPNITFDLSNDGSDLADYMNNVVKPYLQTWYPKVSDALAYPDYMPSNTLNIRTDPDGPLGQADPPNAKIRIQPQFVRDAPLDAPGALLHEATHVIQNYPNGDVNPYNTGVVIEGMPDWPRDWLTLERIHIPRMDAQLSQAFSESAGMLQWGEVKYSPGLVKRVNVNIHNASNGLDNLVKSATGKTPDELYAEYKSQYYGSIGQIKGIGGKCVEIAGSSAANGAKMQLAPCNSAMKNQLWSTIYQDGGPLGPRKRGAFVNGLLGANKCIDVQSSGTADGTIVHSWDCNYGDAQTWIQNSNGTLLNPNSNRCLSTTNDGSDDGNQLIIRDCTASPGQVWVWPK